MALRGQRSKGRLEENAVVADPAGVGRFDLGTLRFVVDPYIGFRTNSFTPRLEIKGLFHVRNAKGARRIAAS